MTPDPIDDQIGNSLLLHLRDALARPGLEYSEPPRRIPGGVENRIYGFRLREATPNLSGRLILRLFGDHDHPTRASREYALQNALADLGFPVPRVIVCGTDIHILGGPFTIMERLPGRVVFSNTITVFNALQMWMESSFVAPRRLAEVQSSLHALDASAVARAMETAGIEPSTVGSRLEEIRLRIERGSLAGLRNGMDWLLGNQPQNRGPITICHGDLWAGNILTEGSKITGVIDWSMATLAPPEFDVAATNMGMRYDVPDMPGPLAAFLTPIQYDASQRYLRAYRRRRRLDRARLAYYQVMRCLGVCSWVYERRLGIVGAIRADTGPNIWDVPGSTKRFEAHFRRYTGIALDMPMANFQFFY